MLKAAVILAGCGRMDGSEVHESTLALLYLAKQGVSYQCFAPDEPQVKVLNHLTSEPMHEIRNQMIEGARIARGNIKPLSQANASEFDALVIPGGNGAFANLGHGPGGLNPALRDFIEAMANAAKPIAAICIAPVLVSRALGSRGISLTIGNNPETAREIESNGALHVECTVDNCVVDNIHKIVSCPAYMLGPGIAEVASGIEQCINALVALCKQSA